MADSAQNAKTVFGAVLDFALHERMRDDAVRCDAFDWAIARQVEGRVVLDIGTGPFALLALRCARAGAKHVYAIEVVPECVPLARHAVQEAGYGDVVTVLEGYSTDIELPQKVDVVVHEILGNIASEEGVALSIADAAARLVREPGSTGWSIPHRAQTLVAPTAFPPVFENHVEVPAPRREYRLEQFPEELLLAEPQVWEDLQFDSPLTLAWEQTLFFECRRAGPLCGVLHHMCIWFDPEGVVQIDTLQQQTTWRVVAVLFGRSVQLSAGDRLAIKCAAILKEFPSYYRFEVTLHPGTPHEQYFDGRTVELKM